MPGRSAAISRAYSPSRTSGRRPAAIHELTLPDADTLRCAATRHGDPAQRAAHLFLGDATGHLHRDAALPARPQQLLDLVDVARRSVAEDAHPHRRPAATQGRCGPHDLTVALAGVDEPEDTDHR